MSGLHSVPIGKVWVLPKISRNAESGRKTSGGLRIVIGTTSNRDKPYNDLPLLPPKAELESKVVLRKAIGANKALAELKGAGELIPNQGVLINAIVLQ
jgi:hypothetical protein